MRRQINQELGRTWGRTTSLAARQNLRGEDRLARSREYPQRRGDRRLQTSVDLGDLRSADQVSRLQLHSEARTDLAAFFRLVSTGGRADRHRSRQGRQAAAAADRQDRRSFSPRDGSCSFFRKARAGPAGAPPQYKFGVAHLYRGDRNAGASRRREFRAVLAAPLVPRPAGNRRDRVLPPIPPGLEPREFFQLTTEMSTRPIDAKPGARPAWRIVGGGASRAIGPSLAD